MLRASGSGPTEPWGLHAGCGLTEFVLRGPRGSPRPGVTCPVLGVVETRLPQARATQASASRLSLESETTCLPHPGFPEVLVHPGVSHCAWRPQRGGCPSSWGSCVPAALSPALTAARPRVLMERLVKRCCTCDAGPVGATWERGFLRRGVRPGWGAVPAQSWPATGRHTPAVTSVCRWLGGRGPLHWPAAAHPRGCWPAWPPSGVGGEKVMWWVWVSSERSAE